MEYNSIIEKCEEALAHSEQEPATKEQIREAMIFNLHLYTTPPQPKEPEQEPMALQDDEIYDAAFSAYCRGENSRELFRIMWSNRIACSIGWDRDELKSFARNIAALYTAPPQRTWVGLTDEEKKNIFLKWYGKHWAYTEQVQAVMNSVEAKLKELNT